MKFFCTCKKFLSQLAPLPTPEEMRLWDQHAISFGLPEAMLMENAARGALQCLLHNTGPIQCKNVWLFMGSGNNGGDAACLARHLRDLDANPILFAQALPAEEKQACALHSSFARANGVQFEILPKFQDQSEATAFFAKRITELPDIIVDGLLGTGFHGQLRKELAYLIATINDLSTRQKQIFVLALDIPSGLDAMSGMPSPVAVCANLTASFAAAKPGLLLPCARQWVGTLHVLNIGLPQCLEDSCPKSFYLLDGHALAVLQTLDAQQRNTHKNSYGHVLVLGGSPGLEGAAHLAAASALRSGAGLVSAATPKDCTGAVKSSWPEIMTLALGNTAEWPVQISEELGLLLQRCSALVIGPGMGRSNNAAIFLRSILEYPARPAAVIDADALVLLSVEADLMQKLTARDILSPHPGEAAQLLGCKARDVQAMRPTALKALCALSKAAVILKGAGTLVGQEGQPVLQSPYDIPQLAIAGAGDVLAGCLGAILAAQKDANCQGLSAAGLGVALHCLAGLLCAKDYPKRGARAGDLLNAISLAKCAFKTAPPIKSPDQILPWPAQ